MSAKSSVKATLHADPEDPVEVERLKVSFESDSTLYHAVKLFPEWVVKKSPQFAVDLEKYNFEWANACAKELKVEPRQILIVSNTYLEEQKTTHTLLRFVVQTLTKQGYIIIDARNFDTCSVCNNVIICQERLEAHKCFFNGKCQSCCPRDPRKPL